MTDVEFYTPANTRLKTYHGQKRQLLGNHAGQPAPAWRTSASNSDSRSQLTGSKILITSLPIDVGEHEVEELFQKTVGPLKDSFLIFNSAGKSKGMAVVTFQRPGDASVARKKYHGMIVDGRRMLKVELVVDETMSDSLSTRMPSLAERLQMAPNVPPRPSPASPPPRLGRREITQFTPSRHRRKKHPRRLHKSRAQLDKEMDEYREGLSVVNENVNGSAA